ncbi:hypothetical protein, partial [Streptomyces exfoliatus]
NTSGKPVTVKAKLAYVQAAVEQTCPGPWGNVGEAFQAKGRTTAPRCGPTKCDDTPSNLRPGPPGRRDLFFAAFGFRFVLASGVCG